MLRPDSFKDGKLAFGFPGSSCFWNAPVNGAVLHMPSIQSPMVTNDYFAGWAAPVCPLCHWERTPVLSYST